jgi:predicted O-methyltransferase YrrM
VEGNSNQLPQQLNDLIFLSKGAKSILEIGFNAGHSSEIFLKNNTHCKVVSFDLGEHPYVYLVEKYINYTYPNRHTLILGDSTKTIPSYLGDTFDVIFIDGGHSLEVATADLENCKRFAHKDTIVIMDDIVYHNHAPWTIGPTRAWKNFVNQGKLIEMATREYSPGRGMCWGKYN